jgi:hypothetical protein
LQRIYIFDVTQKPRESTIEAACPAFAILLSACCIEVAEILSFLQWRASADCFFFQSTLAPNELLRIFLLETALLLSHRSASCQHVYVHQQYIECCIFFDPPIAIGARMSLLVAKSHFYHAEKQLFATKT